MSGLHRKLDTDLIARMANGWKPNNDAKPLKRQKPPRAAATYRTARRNAELRPEHGKPQVWRGIKPTGSVYRPPVRANRSRKWS